METNEDHCQGDDNQHCYSSICFLDEIELYKTVRPYRLSFVPPDDTIPQSNFQRRHVQHIPIHNLRAYKQVLDYGRHGFSVMRLPFSLTTKDCYDQAKVQELFFSPLQAQLRNFFGTPHVEILGHQIRRRHEDFPVSPGQMEHKQPVIMAHIDWTPKEVNRKVRNSLPAKASSILKSRYQYVHAWKPLKGPVKDWPLALCDASSVNPLLDFEPADVSVDVDGNSEENFQIYYRETYRWVYLSEQATDEVWIFRQHDSDMGYGSGIPHAALPNPVAENEEDLRESIEVQILIYWDND